MQNLKDIKEESPPSNTFHIKKDHNKSLEFINMQENLDYLHNIRNDVCLNMYSIRDLIIQLKNKQNLSKKSQQKTSDSLSLINNAEEICEEADLLKLEGNHTHKFTNIKNEDNASTTLNITTDNHNKSISELRNYLLLKSDLTNNHFEYEKQESFETMSIGRKRGKRGKYMMYSEAFKAECIEHARKIGNDKEVAKYFNIPLKKLKRWLEIGPKRLEGGGRKVMDPQMEVDLIKWIEIEKSTGAKLNGKQIQDKAKNLSRVDKFLASKGWLEKFLKKYDIKIEK